MLKREVSVINVPLPAPSSSVNSPTRLTGSRAPEAQLRRSPCRCSRDYKRDSLSRLTCASLIPYFEASSAVQDISFKCEVVQFLRFTIACSGNTYIPFSQQLCCTEPDACDSKKRLNEKCFMDHGPF